MPTYYQDQSTVEQAPWFPHGELSYLADNDRIHSGINMGKSHAEWFFEQEDSLGHKSPAWKDAVLEAGYNQMELEVENMDERTAMAFRSQFVRTLVDLLKQA